MGRVSAEDFSGRYIHYGIREHGMAAAMNGLALHGGFVPYGGTFLCFADYARGAMRLSALMGQRVIYVMTHDSIGLGEDGPTHQPVEHLAMLRATPNLLVFRPADIVETAEAWELALRQKHRPSVLVLSRQNLPMLRHADTPGKRRARGAYLLRDPGARRDATLLATGSEVEIAVAAAERLAAEHGLAVAVVSMPCWELFEEQDAAWRAALLGTAPRIAVEAAARLGWDRWIGEDGGFVGMTGFGASAPAPDLYRHLRSRPKRSPRRPSNASPEETTRHGPHHPSPASRPCRRAWLRRSGLQHQQHGAGPGDHGGGAGHRRAGHPAGLARRPQLRQRHHAGAA